MWVCEHDGVVVADRERHTDYMGHTRYRDARVEDFPKRTPKRAVSTIPDQEADPERTEEGDQQGTPEWFAKEQGSGTITGIQGVENWPPTSPKAEIGKVGE